MKEHEKEAERIIEMFGDKAILHVEGIMSIIEPISIRVNNPSILYMYDEGVDQYHFWQQVKKAIQNK